MAVLTRAVLLAGALVSSGCYAPEVRDCTVTCSAPTDCANGQTCGVDGKCVGSAAPACPTEDPDAGTAATTVKLTVTVDGKGSVVIDGSATTTCGGSGHASCVFELAPAIGHDLVATPASGRVFRMWSGACMGTTTACIIISTTAVVVGAKFTN